MAGTLTISTLSDGTNSTSTTNPIRGSAKAWCNLTNTGGTPTVNRSFNVSSVTITGTANFFVNLTNALPNANIVPYAHCNQLGVFTYSNGTISASVFGFNTYSTGLALYTPGAGTQTFVTIFGD